jgi:hypothetical protein
MYIGARYVPIFADPVEWDDVREYEPLTIVIHDGNCYTSKCYVPKGAQLPPYPEGQTKYWVKTSDYNYQFADLKKTVLDLSRLVEQFQKDNERFTALINNWNTKVEQWEKDMTAWGERLDTVESNVADLTAKLNAEIDRAKAAEQANAAAIAQETADRKQAISDLDAAYKAADAAEAQARAEADTALSNRITANKTDIDAIKAEQVIQNTNISNNAKNISDNAAEIAKHAKRLTDLESNASDWDDVFPDTTIAQEVQKEEAARANADTALNGRCDTIAADVEEVRDIANHKVDQTVFNEADALNVKYGDSSRARIATRTLATGPLPQTRADLDQMWIATDWHVPAGSNNANFGKMRPSFVALKSEVDAAQAAADKANTTIGDWDTDHPGQTISQCATSVENEIAAVDAKADANAANIGDWQTEHPGKTISQAVSEKPGPGEYLPVRASDNDNFVDASSIKQDTEVPADGAIMVYTEYGRGARYPLADVIPSTTPVFDSGMAVPLVGPARKQSDTITIVFPLFHQYQSKTFTLHDSRNMSGTLYVYKFNLDDAPSIQTIPYKAVGAAYDATTKCLRVSFTPADASTILATDTFFIVSARVSDNKIVYEMVFD